MNFNKQKFLSFYANTQYSLNAQKCWDAVENAFKEVYLNKPCPCCDQIITEMDSVSENLMCGAMATIRIEVGKGFLPIMEIASGDAYEGRLDLGNSQKGDGRRFKGRGFIQLTGRANYDHYGKVLGIDLVNNPDLALDVNVSAKILAQYFKERKVDQACASGDWLSVRKLVNGVNRATGLPNGWVEFQNVINQYIK